MARGARPQASFSSPFGVWSRRLESAFAGLYGWRHIDLTATQTLNRNPFRTLRPLRLCGESPSGFGVWGAQGCGRLS
jgi:hypothetical protein